MQTQSASRIDLFELTEPGDLFREIKTAAAEYEKFPNNRLLLFLLFSLNHLREWVADASFAALESKRKSGSLLPKEKLYYELGAMQEFRLIKSLCNRSKHHVTRDGSRTSVTRGMTCDSPCSDSLDKIYYRIDGIDSRAIFGPVIRKYLEWFRGAS